MGDGKIQWHPGFAAAVELELFADRECLVFEREYNLNRKPQQIDLLVTKEGNFQIGNEIGRLFRKYNILEYKSPQDRLDIDTFSKVQSYALTFKAEGKTVDERKMEDITVTLVWEAKPVGLFVYFKEHGIPVTNLIPGIYYVLEGVPFPSQIIVTRELTKEDHGWMKALTQRMDQESMRDFWEQVQTTEGTYARTLADAVLEVCTRAKLGDDKRDKRRQRRNVSGIIRTYGAGN